MANVFIDEAVMTALANLLREFTETETQYYPADMEPAFRALLEASGGEVVLATLDVVQNGFYVPAEGVTGYSSVTVNVPTDAPTNGIVVNSVDASGSWVDVTVYGELPAGTLKGNTSLQAVTLANATSVPANAFDGCTALTSVTLPETVTSIGAYAFRNCSSLTDIDIPAAVTSIGNYAFYGCTAFTSFVVPDTVTSMGTYVFYGCTALVGASISSGVTKVSDYTFYGCTSLASVNIPESVTSIGAYAFYGCSALASIEFPSGLKTIGNYSFQNCTGITAITLPESVTTIGDSAFKATMLTEITIPAGVTSIANYAFHNCTALTAVYWNPPAITSIGSTGYPSFKGCTAIAKVVFGDNVTIIPNFIFREANGSPMGDVVIPEGVTRIGQDAFYGCGLTSINIPASVTEFGTYAFYKCTSLTTVYWNAPSIASVGSTTYPIFDSCSALVNFIIGENVLVLPQYMLRECTGIQSITIPDSVTTIGAQAFYSCTKLASVQIGESENCAIATIGTNAFGSCSALTDITIYKMADSVEGSPWGGTSATVTWAVQSEE